MDERTRPKKIIAIVGEKISRRCSPCGAEAGFLESKTAITSVAKWICPECGTLNEFEVEFRIAAR
jgi:transposase-like protein